MKCKSPQSWIFAALALSSVAARANAVLDWNVTALRTTASAPANPPLEGRNLAIVHAAMFDAVNSIVGEFRPFAIHLDAAKGASPEAAAAAAAHLVLVELYPAQQATLDAAYAAALASIPDGQAKIDGIAVGIAAAGGILAARASDGAAEAIAAPYSPLAGPGFWIPTPPAFLAALDPGWGSIAPFALKTGSQFRPGPPPALDSRQYARDFNEVREIGSATSAVRSQAQTDLARFWVATAQQTWNPAARQVAIARGLSLSQTARLLALLNLASADAFIAAWDAKYAYNQWRPLTAIRGADPGTNPETTPDPSWTPLLVTPRFPDYVAGHAALAGAAQRVLEHVFGEGPGVTMVLTSATAPGVVERYATFKEIADSVVEARVLGGIHWRTSCDVGRRLGERVGRYAVHHVLQPVTAERDDDVSSGEED